MIRIYGIWQTLNRPYYKSGKLKNVSAVPYPIFSTMNLLLNFQNIHKIYYYTIQPLYIIPKFLTRYYMHFQYCIVYTLNKCALYLQHVNIVILLLHGLSWQQYGSIYTFAIRNNSVPATSSSYSTLLCYGCKK